MQHGYGYVPSDSPSDLSALLRELEERIETLESGQRLTRASIRGGRIRLLSEDGEQVGCYGKAGYPIANGFQRTDSMFEVGLSDSRFHTLIDGENGWARPQWSYNWTEIKTIAVTAASYTDTWQTNINILGYALVVVFDVTTGVGTEGNARLLLGPQSSDVVYCPANDTTTCRFVWDISGFENYGTIPTLKIQANRIAGSNDVEVHTPMRCYTQALAMQAQATSGGVASA